MAGSGATVVEATANQNDDGAKRQRSSIGFPYVGLGDAIEVAKAIHEHAGSGECDDAQLAAWLNLSTKSSGYRVRLYGARMYGLIESPSAGSHKLLPLGREIVDASKARDAKVKAFLTVPLFKAIFEQWNGHQLPPTAGLEREIVGLGVAEKQKDRARQVFERSATDAGFFEHGRDRLVKPGAGRPPSERMSPPPAPGGGNGGGGGKGEGPSDPLIQGLVARLPVPDSSWSKEDRIKWLQTAANVFDLVYKTDDGEIVVIEIKAGKKTE